MLQNLVSVWTFYWKMSVYSRLYYKSIDFSTYYHSHSLPFKVQWEAELVPGDTLSAATISWAKRQLAACDSKHDCLLSGGTSLLPTRVLDICHKSPDTNSVRLLASEGQTGRYACLSHCWGNPALMTKTTTKSIDAHPQGIHLSDLPRTFHDAIDVARRLEIEYLGIDSLCIIQDDSRDWDIQASRMADIYENAYVTIAATSSGDGNGGCYRRSLPTTSKRDFYTPLEVVHL